jgi:beta-1,4-mannosyltransferase
MDAVRVLHVPGDHGYVRHLQDDGVPGVTVVPQPEAPGGPWAPSPAIEREWVLEHHDEFDVLHLHFGFESRTRRQLREWLDALHRNGVRVVFTVHDLQNPHLADQGRYLDLLDELITDVDALITLTPGAAREIERRWGRRPSVVPHPHLAASGEIGTPRQEHAPRVVGLHLKSLRANLLAVPVLQSLLVAVDRLPGTRLRVDVHEEALQQEFVRHDPELLRWLTQAGDRIDLRVHERFDDEALQEYLREIDVSVLAYAFGTHSGWLELCHDLGTPVLAGPTGYLADQQRLVQVSLIDEDEVHVGLVRALAGYEGLAATPQERRRQRTEIAVAHRDLYRHLLGRSAA